MRSEQQLRAQARQNARTAPKPDPAIGKTARAEAEAAMAKFNRSVEPAYKTQAKPCGTIMHRGSGRPMSEFNDPSANTVGAGKKAEDDFGRGLPRRRSCSVFDDTSQLGTQQNPSEFE